MPDVILDADVSDGLFSLVLWNVGARGAFDVVTRLDPPFTGLAGEKAITELLLFRRLPFLAPGKRLVQFVDPLAAYAARKQPLQFTATITWRDREGRGFEQVIRHDLRVYLEMGQAR